MPTMIGTKNSNFDPQAYAQLTQENSGPVRITTEDVLEGWKQEFRGHNTKLLI